MFTFCSHKITYFSLFLCLSLSRDPTLSMCHFLYVSLNVNLIFSPLSTSQLLADGAATAERAMCGRMEREERERAAAR